MPYIRIRGVDEKTCLALSKEAGALAEIVNTDQANFTFERVQSQFFENGSTVEGSPFVEVIWFPRTQDTADRVARHITTSIKSQGTHEYVTVVFMEVARNLYFENGSHFA